MITDNGDEGITVTYATSKAEVHAASDWESMMKFIVNTRPVVVYQFWIDKGVDGLPDLYKMLFSKVIPAPDSFVPSEV